LREKTLTFFPMYFAFSLLTLKAGQQ